MLERDTWSMGGPPERYGRGILGAGTHERGRPLSSLTSLHLTGTGVQIQYGPVFVWHVPRVRMSLFPFLFLILINLNMPQAPFFSRSELWCRRAGLWWKSDAATWLTARCSHDPMGSSYAHTTFIVNKKIY